MYDNDTFYIIVFYFRRGGDGVFHPPFFFKEYIMQVNINDLVYLSSKVIKEYIANKVVNDVREHLVYRVDNGGVIEMVEDGGELQFRVYINEGRNIIEVYQINKPFSKNEHTLIVRKIINFCDLLIRESEGKIEEKDFFLPALNLSLKNARFAFA